MRRIPFSLPAIAALLVLAAPLALAGAAPTVIMISLDGTRPADLTEERLPAVVALAKRGARAERLIPSFPTNTFPNHVTLVTGVSPQRHGIVDNSFVDPERGLFQKKDIPAWIEVEPLWSIVERQGIVSASFHWVGSEGDWPGGSGPRYWKPFSAETDEAEKVDQILAWLDLKGAARPPLITSWFHGADHASHHHGPDSPEVIRSLRRQDVALARLLDGISERGLWGSTSVLIVSDHGMMVPQRRIDLGAALTRAGIDARVIGIGGFVSVRVDDRAADRVIEIARQLGLSAWRRDDAPASVPVRNVRFGAVVVVAPRGTAVVYQGLVLTGFHGHRPEDPEMAAVLVAAGRGIASGAVLQPVRNIDVAPTLLALLDLETPDWMQGRPIRELLTHEHISQPEEGGP